MITTTKYLAYISVLAIICTHLALTDIYHNKEPDLTLEWFVVQVTIFIIAIFIVFVLMTLKKITKEVK